MAAAILCMNSVASYHATPVEAVESAAEAGAGHLLFYPIAPPLPKVTQGKQPAETIAAVRLAGTLKRNGIGKATPANGTAPILCNDNCPGGPE